VQDKGYVIARKQAAAGKAVSPLTAKQLKDEYRKFHAKGAQTLLLVISDQSFRTGKEVKKFMEEVNSNDIPSRALVYCLEDLPQLLGPMAARIRSFAHQRHLARELTPDSLNIIVAVGGKRKTFNTGQLVAVRICLMYITLKTIGKVFLYAGCEFTPGLGRSWSY
jgi:hypothetical protein